MIIYLDEKENSLSYGDSKFKLSKAEMKILQYFSSHPDNVISSEELLNIGWPKSIVSINSVPVAMANLRKILGAGIIETVKGEGYFFDSNNSNVEFHDIGKVNDDCESVENEINSIKRWGHKYFTLFFFASSFSPVLFFYKKNFIQSRAFYILKENHR
ncbi:winged helix-turn-helix domain-containing protein [Shewanella colwelliana]|uniref:winged helix-turn-helix domain-containing protein n=1 Tax=Shewanella colwelliana TaxID=23 RepID=UPI00373584F8